MALLRSARLAAAGLRLTAVATSTRSTAPTVARAFASQADVGAAKQVQLGSDLRQTDVSSCYDVPWRTRLRGVVDGRFERIGIAVERTLGKSAVSVLCCLMRVYQDTRHFVSCMYPCPSPSLPPFSVPVPHCEQNVLAAHLPVWIVHLCVVGLQSSVLPYVIGLGGIGAGLYFAKEQGYLDGFLGVAPAANVWPIQSHEPHCTQKNEYRA